MSLDDIDENVLKSNDIDAFVLSCEIEIHLFYDVGDEDDRYGEIWNC